jgi:uncharacterized protein YcfJ
MNPIRTPAFAAVAAAVLLSACTTLPPNGPSVMALPGTGKTFDQFRLDDQECRQYAFQQTGISPNNAAVDSGVRSAAIGTLLGAAAGAAFNGGRGAAVGAGAGLLLGSSAGAGAANESSYGIQRRYDAAYVQCMYARGHRVPVSGRMMSGDGGYAPPSSQGVPPPPPGMPPPPPPGY